jgi:hypothetical protein
MAAAGVSVYWQHKPQEVAASQGFSGRPRPAVETRFHCEGKKHCAQVSSCDEARFYLNNCPGTEMIE